MADDPYQILGLQRTATDAEIRAAYRKLAKRHHPDLNPGKPEAAERFKQINAANDLLSDPDKRARYDRGEIDAAGNEKPPERPFYRDFADAAGRQKYRTSTAGIDPEDLESILAQAFGAQGFTPGGFSRGGGTAGGRQFNFRGQDAQYGLTVSFLDAVERHHAPHHPAGRAHAGCAHSARRA